MAAIDWSAWGFVMAVAVADCLFAFWLKQDFLAFEINPAAAWLYRQGGIGLTVAFRIGIPLFALAVYLLADAYRELITGLAVAVSAFVLYRLTLALAAFWSL